MAEPAIANTMKGQRGKGGGGIGPEETLVVPALTTRAGNTLDDQQTGQLIAAPLSHGSNPNSNMAGRRREDDVNLVAGPLQTGATPRGHGQAGVNDQAAASNHIVPISGDALRGEGAAKTPSEDAAGQVRLRDPGLGIGDEGDPAYTLSATSSGAVALPLCFDSTLSAAHKINEDVSPPLKVGSGIGVGSPPAVTVEAEVKQAEAAVRRLTPVECERLQGFPDEWTNPTGREADSRRYAALGDAVTVNVAHWIGLRIAAAEA